MRRRAKILRASHILVTALALSLPTSTSFADDIPMTIDGQINCAHPANAITTTCRGEAPPPPVATPPVTTEAPPPVPSGTPVVPAVPLTIDGVINCAHPDNAITTTCRGEAPPPPANTPPVTTEAAPAGTTITYSGDTAINCALPENKENNICQPMTNADGSINCAQADNAITTTCWERAQTMRQMGAEQTEVDCSLDRFKDYPVCTGVKPQAVIDYEKSQETATKLPIADTKCADPAFISSPECLTPIVATSTPPTSATPSDSKTVNSDKKENDPGKQQPPAQITGSIDFKSRNGKTTVLKVDLDSPGVKIRVIATKKGAPTVSQTITTDSNGNKTVKFSRNLKGYTVKIVVDGEVVDQTKV